MTVDEFLQRYPLIKPVQGVPGFWTGKNLCINAGYLPERAAWYNKMRDEFKNEFKFRRLTHEICHFVEIEPKERIFKKNFGLPMANPYTGYFENLYVRNNTAPKYAKLFCDREIKVLALESQNKLTYTDHRATMEGGFNSLNLIWLRYYPLVEEKYYKVDKILPPGHLSTPAYTNNIHRVKSVLLQIAKEYLLTVDFWDRLNERYEMIQWKTHHG